jgi:hypothetical protein
MPIPRRLIQTGQSRDLPPLARAAATNLRLLHPGWEYLYFDDDDVLAFIDTEFPEHRRTFDAFPHNIQRFDFFRYLAVYRLGGFYFDLDVFLSEPLGDLLGCDAVFPFEELTINRHLRTNAGLDWEVGNYAFGAAPGDPFLGAVIDNCVRGQLEPCWAGEMLRGIPKPLRGRYEVLTTTGPGLLSRTMAESPGCARGVTVLFPPDVRKEESWHLFGRYGIHLMEGSWRTKGNVLWRRLAWMWEARERARATAASRHLGPTRQLKGSVGQRVERPESEPQVRTP